MQDSKANYSYIYLYKKMFPYIRKYLFRFVVAMLITIPIGALDGVIPLALRYYIDKILPSKNLFFAFLVPVGVVGFSVIQGVLTYISTYLNGWLSQKVTTDIKYDLYRKLLGFETSFFDKGSSGIVIQRFSGDADAVTNGILGNVKTLLTRIFTSLGYMCVLIYNSWILAIIAISVISLILIPLARTKKRIKMISNGLAKSSGSLLSKFNETFAGNKVITSYNLANYQANRFQNTQKEIFRLNIKKTQLDGLMTPFMHVVASIGVAAVVGVGSYLIISGRLTIGAFASFIVALLLLYTPIKSIGNTTISAQVSFTALERVLELFNLTSRIQNKENPVKLDSIKTGIKFENVWFEYEQGRPVLRDINMEISLGESIAFVGNSGGGKSTVVNLIPRFYDVTEGRITIDSIDLRDIELESLRNKIAIVFQDNFLFSGTIRDNIVLGKLNATDEEINKAVEDAYLTEFISTLERGIDTEIGERGVLLSGGQKQRIAIARALLKNAPIVILDEATSALDNKSEAIVQKAIDKLMENRTVFVIAHRLSTVKNASRIFVIDEGKILETGNHEELLNRPDGIYKSLYLTQFKTKESDLQTI